MTQTQTKLTNTPKAAPQPVMLSKRDAEGNVFAYIFTPSASQRDVVDVTLASATGHVVLPMVLLSARQMFVGLLAQGWAVVPGYPRA